MRKTAESAFIKQVRMHFRKIYRKKGSRGSSGISFGEDLRKTIASRNRKQKIVPEDIQVWLALFDEAVGFWLLVWGFYREELEAEETKPASPLSICMAILSGRIFQDMICIRELVVSGFFVQSNVVARSLIEAIDLMHLLNSRPELADDFKGVETNDQATQLWHSHCSKKKIDKHVKQRWLWFLNGDDKVVSAFFGQRDDYLDLVGMSAHPSFASSLVTFMDKPKDVEEPVSIFEAALGSVSHMSKFTMHLILLRVFEYGLLWSGPQVALYKSEKRGRENSHKDLLEKALNVIFSIVMTADKSEDVSNLFPEFQTYWPRKNFKANR